MSQSSLESGGRFVVQHQLGRGGFGAVYRAYDRKREQDVAIKVLHRMDPAMVIRFKREFRALADVRHPGLVRLGELLSQGEELFFTMELIEGVDLLSWVRRHDGSTPVGETVNPAAWATFSPGADPSPEVAPVGEAVPVAAPSRFDEARLRDGFAQLAEAVSALHSLGMLHRDLKPSNVLVSSDGRVAVLDFGLVANLGEEELYQSLNIVGTPAYMSPEQGAGKTVSKASDWYAVGVMMFETLTGRLPFSGSSYQVLLERQSSDAPPAREFSADIPADLASLCDELLRRDPAARPSGEEVVQRLRRTPAAAAPSPAPRTGPPFLGRDRELAALRESLAEARGGRAVTVLLHGPSGMGKSALTAHFLAEVSAGERDAVVLAGRCYERESVPYKALDSIVDDLGHYLFRLESREISALLPRDWQSLTRLFPVLQGVHGGAAGKRAGPQESDAQELRRRGFAAFRELFVRLTDRRTVVVCIDDLQWGDRDSGLVLRELMRPPNPPPLLLLVCYRSEDVERSAILRLLSEAVGPGAARRELEVGSLKRSDARALALALLGEETPTAVALADGIALESGGSPFFIDELARPNRLAAGSAGEPLSLRSALKARLAGLDGEPRRLLEVIALASRPVDLEVANQAAGLESRTTGPADLLQTERWIRRCALEDREAYETFHDRIRETVVSLIPHGEFTDRHRRLAVAWESAPTADAETVAEHYLSAGERETASCFAVRAAELAAAALAFDRAARLYQMSLDAWRPDQSGRSTLRAKLATALANAGRGAESGRAYLAAADDAEPAEALEFRRRGAEQFLISGNLREGLQALASVLGTVGMRLAPTPKRALIGLLACRLQLAVRGLRFHERTREQVSPELLTRTDVCWSVGVGLGMVDPVRSAHFQARSLLLALRAGEPGRVARSLLMELGFSSTGGGRTARRTARLRGQCRTLVVGRGDPYLEGLLAVEEGIMASMAGEFPRSLDACTRAEEILCSRCTGVIWELDTARLYQLHALANMGSWNELASRLPPLRSEALERGDRYLATYILTRTAYLFHLAADNPAGAEEEQEQSLAGWQQPPFQVQHYWNWFAHGEIDLYAGRPERAWERLRAQWREFRHSLLPRVQAVRIEALFLRARTAVALAARAPAGEAPGLLAAAEKDARALESVRMPWAEGLAALARAGIASVRGDRGRARELAITAEAGLEAVGMMHFAAVARRRRAALTGDEGDAEVGHDACARLRELGAANPERMADMLAPGRWD